MKKLILVLVILLAVPAFGALNISLVKQSPDGNKVDLNYADANSLNLPRAFALKVVVASPAKITDVTNYKIGESNSTNRGYGIYPARIVIEANGTVTGWGTPLAEPTDPGAGTGLGTNQIVLEFGSLYVGDVNSPATSGTLCTLKMDCNGATGDVNIVATEEEQYRGGAVLENGTAPDPNLTATLAYACTPPLPAPGQATTPGPNDHGNNIARSTNLTWAAGSDANSHRIFFGPNSLSEMAFKVEQSGLSYDPCTTGAGLLAQGRKFYWRIDEKNATGTTTGVVWDFNTEECLKSTDPGYYITWILTGRPNCWCFKKQCRGDGNGSSFGNKPVTSADLTTYKAGYNKHISLLRTTNVVDSAGVPGVCADYNHSQFGAKPVTSADLTIYKTYYNKANTPGVVPDCNSTHINFWTN